MANNLHNVLEAACKVLRVDPATHDTGMKPVLYNPTYVALALWIAQRALPKIDGAFKARIEGLLPLARQLIANEKIEKETRRRLHDFDRDFSSTNDGALVATGLATEMIEASINNVCGKGARAAAGAAARLLGRSFLDELATEILRLDAVTLVERQELDIDSSKIAACLWRGSTGAKVTHTIVRLADGSEEGTHGLIAKTKGRWTWLAGARDDVLASVPDAQMEEAVAAVLGKNGGAQAKATPKKDAAERPEKIDEAEVVALPGKLGAVAISPDGRMWAASNDGRLFEWVRKTKETRTADARVGTVRGMAAGAGGIVVTWSNKQLTRWTDLRPESIADAADGAFVTDDGSIVWWHEDQIHFGKKTTYGFPDQRLSLWSARGDGYVLAVGSAGCFRFDLRGAKIGELPLAATSHSLSRDGKRIATWKSGPIPRSIVISSADGKTLLTLTVDSGHIDRVVFANTQHFLVRYHQKKRVAVFDERGALVHRLQARELGGKGSAVDELFPLMRGSVLAFAPYPKGETLLVSYAAQLIKRWALERFYTGGTSFLADAGDRVLFAHSRDSTRVLRF